MGPILAAIFPQWRDRDERLCREIVARGICAPTGELGIAVRATLAHVDSLRAQRDDAVARWEGALDQLGITSRVLLRVVVERDDARAELAALRASIKDIAGRMADNGQT